MLFSSPNIVTSRAWSYNVVKRYEALNVFFLTDKPRETQMEGTKSYSFSSCMISYDVVSRRQHSQLATGICYDVKWAVDQKDFFVFNTTGYPSCSLFSQMHLVFLFRTINETDILTFWPNNGNPCLSRQRLLFCEVSVGLHACLFKWHVYPCLPSFFFTISPTIPLSYCIVTVLWCCHTLHK